MSELKEFLSPAQLIKHYELLQFLVRHPNTFYTLAQLDYYLPHGAALQRFPVEWLEYVEDGGCSARNVELYYRTAPDARRPTVEAAEPTSSSITEVPPPATVTPPAQPRTRDAVTMICRQPSIHTLAELQSLVQSPSSLLDAEGCVALHTEQVHLPSHLLLLAQRAGLVYYFPDKYDRVELTSNRGKARPAAVKDVLGGEIGGGGSMRERLAPPHTFLTLPPGVRVRFKQLTLRGVPIKDEHCLPTRLEVGERVLAIFDNITAVAQGRAAKLSLSYRLNGLRPGDEAAPPLRVRTQLVSLPAATGAEPRSALQTNAVSAASSIEPQCDAVAQQIRMELEAVRSANLVLLLQVNDCVSTVSLQLTTPPMQTPGVLIGRERSPASFTLPASLALHDDLVCPDIATATTVTAAHTPGRGVDDAMGTLHGQGNKARALPPPLPWWQNVSPLVHVVRDSSYPTESVVQAATAVVFTAQALTHEATMRSTRLCVQGMQERAGYSDGGAGRVRRRRSRTELRNKHLLHFGLDMSVPFTHRPPAEEIGM